MPRDDLLSFLEVLDVDTRSRWERYLLEIDAEVEEKGPQAASDHLEAAFRHLLAVGWVLRRCYADDEAGLVLGTVKEAASSVENAKGVLAIARKKPEWSQ
jgi:hypothetical protein